jgi:hypothetical protein
MSKKFKTKIKIKPMLQKHEGAKSIKRIGIEFRVDYSSRLIMPFFIIGFMSNYYYIGLYINKQKILIK